MTCVLGIVRGVDIREESADPLSKPVGKVPTVSKTQRRSPVRHLGATGPPRGGQKSRGGKGAGAAIGGLGNSWAREMGGAEKPGPKTLGIHDVS